MLEYNIFYILLAINLFFKDFYTSQTLADIPVSVEQHKCEQNALKDLKASLKKGLQLSNTISSCSFFSGAGIVDAILGSFPLGLLLSWRLLAWSKRHINRKIAQLNVEGIDEGLQNLKVRRHTLTALNLIPSLAGAGLGIAIKLGGASALGLMATTALFPYVLMGVAVFSIICAIASTYATNNAIKIATRKYKEATATDNQALVPTVTVETKPVNTVPEATL